MQSTETWKPIPGYEGIYSASDTGRIRRDATGRIMRQSWDSRGYLKVGLRKDGHTKALRIHSLVLLTFVGPRPFGLEGCHRNGDRSDNSPDNLRWGTHAENIDDRTEHGTQWNAAKVECDRGHEFDETNTYIRRDGSRQCRRCDRDKKRAQRARRKLPVLVV